MVVTCNRQRHAPGTQVIGFPRFLLVRRLPRPVNLMKLSLLSSLLVLGLGAGSVAACGGGASSGSATAQAPRAATGDSSCPASVPGTSVTVEDTDTGAALVFVTTGDVAELRKRVTAMASMHNQHHGAMGPLPDGKDTAGAHAGHDMSGHEGHDMSGHAGHDMSGHEGHDMSKMGGGGMMGVHSKAKSVEIEGGAKLVFTSGAADVARLQSELRMHAQHMSAGTCAMGAS